MRVTALFNNYGDADRAINMLTAEGFPRSAVGVVAPEAVGAKVPSDGVLDHPPVDAAEGAGEGAVLGGLAGILVGVVALAVPGVGPLFVAGALASVITSALAGVTAGAVTGGLLGAFSHAGISEPVAKAYAEGVQAGGVIISVETDRLDEAESILHAAGGTHVYQTELSYS
jgi:hypothetical protein